MILIFRHKCLKRLGKLYLISAPLSEIPSVKVEIGEVVVRRLYLLDARVGERQAGAVAGGIGVVACEDVATAPWRIALQDLAERRCEFTPVAGWGALEKNTPGPC